MQQPKDLLTCLCELLVTVDRIERYFFDEFGVKLLQNKCISLTRSFKGTMLTSETEQMLDSERWQENVRIRRFFYCFFLQYGLKS